MTDYPDLGRWGSRSYRHRHLTLRQLADCLSVRDRVDQLMDCEERDAFLSVSQHLAAICNTCGDIFRQVAELRRRFKHWNDNINILEGSVADSLLDELLQRPGPQRTLLTDDEADDRFFRWCVAWVALERAGALLPEDAGSEQALELSLLALKIAEDLDHPDYGEDYVWGLRSLAAATAVAAAVGRDEPEATQWRCIAEEGLEQLDFGPRGTKARVRRLLARAMTQGPVEGSLATDLRVGDESHLGSAEREKREQSASEPSLFTLP